MKRLSSLFIVLVFISCREEVLLPHAPNMKYTELHDTAVAFNQYYGLDVDGDGKRDFSFETLLVGDPVLKRDRKQFYINSKINTFLLVNNQDQVPVLNKEAMITITPPESFQWYEVSASVLAEKIINEDETTYWDGPWKSATHQYIPLLIKKDSVKYTGWIEISFDNQAEKLILHKSAICRESDKDIKAGR